jgi:diguanylate cyclase (GGDEF)-like protein
MKLPVFTVTQKVAAGYLLLVAFSLVALVFALTSLRTQTERSEQLVEVDFKALNLARSLRQNVTAWENLARQAVILRDDTLIALLDRRDHESSVLWNELTGILPVLPDELVLARQRLDQERTPCLDVLKMQSWTEADACLAQVSPHHTLMVQSLERFIAERQKGVDTTLVFFSEASERAYRTTLVLAFLGIGLSAPVAMAIILGIHRSIVALTRATKEIAAGSFEHPVAIDRGDEFGLLAREFTEMGKKLRQFEQLCLDANPLTHLPGSLALEREMAVRIAADTPFAHLYVDLDHFKAYNDRYGYRAGSDVIAQVADLIREVVAQLDIPEALIGHIGGDDFVILTSSLEAAEGLAQELICRFDRTAPSFYSEEDRREGAFIGIDRFGEERRFTLMTVSIAIVWSAQLASPSPHAISQECVKMKDHLKSTPTSNYMIDRRRII